MCFEVDRLVMGNVSELLNYTYMQPFESVI